MQYRDFRRTTHVAALVFVLALILLVAIFFATFALGPYQIYNRPISNVVATTQSVGSSGAILSVTASGLNSGTKSTIWLDPQVNYGSNGYPASVNPTSGNKLGNATADSSGNLNVNVSIPSSVLNQIENESKSVHSVWVIGFSGNTTGNTAQSISITPDSEKNYSAATLGYGIGFFVTLYVAEIPITFSYGTLFIVLWTVYLVLFAMALNGPLKSIIGALKVTAKSGLSGAFSNSMLATVAVYTTIIGSSVLITLLQQNVGISTGSLPSADPLYQYLELSIAPIREELGFRVIPIGLAAFGILLYRGRLRDAILSLWHPSRYLKKNDSKEQYRTDLNISLVLIGISAFLFGLAHYVIGAGWGPGKITSAALAGVALGALYYKYGLPAAILAHWADDYSLFSLSQNPVPSSVFDIVALYIEVLSIISAIVLLVLFVRKIRNRKVTPTFTTPYTLTTSGQS